MSRIINPNPLRITVIVNEATGQCDARINRPVDATWAASVLLQLATAYLGQALAGRTLVAADSSTEPSTEKPAEPPTGNLAGKSDERQFIEKFLDPKFTREVNQRVAEGNNDGKEN